MIFAETKRKVLNRGVPPDGFLRELVEWGKAAPAEIFEPNTVKDDVYALVHPQLGPWASIDHRRAAMLEVMRVHAGFESSWNWNEGVDKTNATSMRSIEGQETGAFQVSFDSLRLAHDAMMPFAKAHGIETPRKFIDRMKADHRLALEFYARLVRVNTKWAGPLVRGEINQWLSPDAVDEFETFLTA